MPAFTVTSSTTSSSTQLTSQAINLIVVGLRQDEAIEVMVSDDNVNFADCLPQMNSSDGRVTRDGTYVLPIANLAYVRVVSTGIRSGSSIRVAII